jgi:hypothetical protein
MDEAAIASDQHLETEVCALALGLLAGKKLVNQFFVAQLVEPAVINPCPHRYRVGHARTLENL